MNTTRCKRGSQNRRTRSNHFLTALTVAAMVMVLTVPVFAAEAAVTTSGPDAEVSTSIPDLIETPADEDISNLDSENDASEPASTPTTGPVTTFDELLDAIEHASPNDVIELGAYIMSTPSELVLGRTDCPVRKTAYKFPQKHDFLLQQKQIGL